MKQRPPNSLPRLKALVAGVYSDPVGTVGSRYEHVFAGSTNPEWDAYRLLDFHADDPCHYTRTRLRIILESRHPAPNPYTTTA